MGNDFMGIRWPLNQSPLQLTSLSYPEQQDVNVKSLSRVKPYDLENQKYFDRWARDYDNGRISEWFQYTQQLAIGEFDLKRDAKVLDVGCGTGHAVLRLASLLSEGKAFGIDISTGMVAKASANVPDALRQRIEFVQASSDCIPYTENQFDHVLCTNSFHHYPRSIDSLREIRRVLKPGGQIVILENAPDLSWYTRAWDWFLKLTEKGHIRYYTSAELGELLREAGFARARLCHLRNEFLCHGKLYASIQVWTGYAPDPK